MMVAGVPVPLAILATLGIGAICGVFSGSLVAYAGLQPFIVTLGAVAVPCYRTDLYRRQSGIWYPDGIS